MTNKEKLEYIEKLTPEQIMELCPEKYLRKVGALLVCYDTIYGLTFDNNISINGFLITMKNQNKKLWKDIYSHLEALCSLFLRATSPYMQKCKKDSENGDITGDLKIEQYFEDSDSFRDILVLLMDRMFTSYSNRKKIKEFLESLSSDNLF